MFGISSADKNVVGVIDVGSGSAAVGILQLRKKEPALMQAAFRAPLSFEERTEAQTISAITGAINEAGEKALAFYNAQSSHPSPGSLFVFLRVPWCRSEAIQVKQKLETESYVTDKLISTLAKQALPLAKEIDSQGLLEASVTQIQLNGYTIANIKGKRAHHITVSVILSDCNLQLKAAVQQAASTIFPSLKPQWRSHTRAALKILGNSAENSRDSLVFDVGTEGTSICVVRKGILEQQVSVPDGSREILRRISPQGMPEETLALLSLLERDQTGDATDAMRVSIAAAEPLLVKVFGEQFSKLAARRRLPNKLLLVVHPDLAPLLSRFLSRIDFAQFTVTSQPFAVLSLSAKNVSRYVIPGNGTVPDPSLSIASAFVNIDESE